MRIGSSLVLVLAASFFASVAYAESPSHGADANLYFERRGDASGGEGDGLARASLYTGAATLSVPIDVPRGTGGIEPGLAIGYSSARGRAEAGAGWSLSLPVIRRSTKYGSHRARLDLSTDAIFELSGDELASSEPATYEFDPFGCNAERFYSKVESHQKILFCRISNADEYWVVYSKDGSFSTFGKTSSARAEYINGTSSRIFEWSLEARTDAHGISWRAVYTKTGEWPRLDSIRYALLNVFGTESTIGDLREVDVVWQTRTDKVVEHRYGIQRVLQDRIAAERVNEFETSACII